MLDPSYPTDPHQIARGIRLLRVQAGMSQRQLASRAGMSQGRISLIESGARHMTVPTLLRILAAGNWTMQQAIDATATDDAQETLAGRR